MTKKTKTPTQADTAPTTNPHSVTLKYSAARAERVTNALREKYRMPRAGLTKLHQHAVREAMSPDPKTCRHPSKMGDNYGQTCGICGAQLSGYGKGAAFQTCFHFFVPIGDDESSRGGEICMYCEEFRLAPGPQNGPSDE